MVAEKTVKVLSLVLIAVMVIEAVFLALRKINLVLFWISLAVIGIIAYKVIPSIKKRK